MNVTNAEQRPWRIIVLAVFVLGSLIALFAMPPITQDPAYHLFSDARTYFGVPNMLNVASNIPFLIVGYIGVRLALRDSPASTRPAWVLFFIAIFLVGLGSSYYHWSPANPTLVWDRLPMTLGFMALFVTLIGEYFDRRLVRPLLWPALVLGASSVLVWVWTGDLRFYAWVQFMPLGVIALLLVLYPSRLDHRGLLFLTLGLYVAAKVFEFYDPDVFRVSGEVISGHSLKHLFAAGGALAVFLFARGSWRVE